MAANFTPPIISIASLTVRPGIVAIAKGDVPDTRTMSLAGILRSADTLLLRYVRTR